jgi:hypothetical protein
MIQIITKKILKLKEIKEKVIKLYKNPSFRNGVRKGVFISSSFIFVFQITNAPVLAFLKHKNTLKKRKYLKTWFSIKEWRSYFKSGMKSSPEYRNLLLNIKEHSYPFFTGSFFGIVFGTLLSYFYTKLNYVSLVESNSLK